MPAQLIAMNKLYEISKNAMLNEVESQGVVFCQSEIGEKIYYLNDTSTAVVLFLQNGRKAYAEIVNEILRLFDVERSECEADIEQLLGDLVGYEIVNVIEK